MCVRACVCVYASQRASYIHLDGANGKWFCVQTIAIVLVQTLGTGLEPSAGMRFSCYCQPIHTDRAALWLGPFSLRFDCNPRPGLWRPVSGNYGCYARL